MLTWALTFFIIAILAGLFGFTGIAGAASGIAQILFFIFIVLFIISLVARAVRGEPPVNTPIDAYKCFMATDLDILVLGNCVMEKQNQINFNLDIE